jgi:(S)-sulfolactate dehydrogenase
MRIIITEVMEDGAVEMLRRDFDVHHDATLVDDPARLAALMPGADGLIVRNRTQVRGAILDAAVKLKAVGRMGVGLDNLDTQTLEKRGIPYFPATGANSLAVVEYTIATAMILLRGAYRANAAMLAGRFPKFDLLGRECAGKTFGLVGFGEIARGVAAKARALDFEIAVHTPRPPRDDPDWKDVRWLTLKELMGESDVVSLHLPFTPETADLIGVEELAAAKPGTVLINTARGEVLDERALVEALKSGRLGGAAIDVHREEPLSRAAAAVYDGVPNLILTPHIAGNTIESNIRVCRMVADAVSGALKKMF